jgi:hypothetical protein
MQVYVGPIQPSHRLIFNLLQVYYGPRHINYLAMNLKSKIKGAHWKVGIFLLICLITSLFYFINFFLRGISLS